MNVYRVRIEDRQPCLVEADSFGEAINRVIHEKEFAYVVGLVMDKGVDAIRIESKLLAENSTIRDVMERCNV